VNSVNIIGNLTRDPELRTTPSGMAVGSLGVAVNDRVKKDGEWTDAAYFFNVTVWGAQAESCAQYLSKGKKVGISGKLTWREWEGDNGKRTAVEITAHHVEFLTPKGEGESGGYTAPAASTPADDDIPF